MTPLTKYETQAGQGGGEPLLRSESARRAIAMAVVLCAGIAGGILLSESYDERLTDYGNHAASYLAEVEAPDAPSLPVTTVSAGGGAETICRAYSQDVAIGGQAETIHGTACLGADGTWNLNP